MGESIILFLIKGAIAAAILVGGIWGAKKLRDWLPSFIEKCGVDRLLANFFSSIAYILVVAFIIIAALGQLGIQTTSLVAIIGAAGLAVGFALQGSLSNFAAGVMIIAFKPFKTGDLVEAGGAVGVIDGIEIFSTTMRTGDNKLIIIPNSNITDSNIVNYSTQNTRRVDLTFGIGYDDDLKTAKQVLQQIVSEDQRILKSPEPVIAVSELADSSVNIIVRSWVKTEDYWEVYWDLTEEVKLRFDETGISIPYPQQDLHLYPSKGEQDGQSLST